MKLYWKLAEWFNKTAIAIWILETVFFLIRDGWHWKAASPEEKVFDSIVSTLWMMTFCCYFWAAIRYLGYKIERTE